MYAWDYCRKGRNESYLFYLFIHSFVYTLLGSMTSDSSHRISRCLMSFSLSDDGRGALCIFFISAFRFLCALLFIFLFSQTLLGITNMAWLASDSSHRISRCWYLFHSQGIAKVLIGFWSLRFQISWYHIYLFIYLFI